MSVFFLWLAISIPWTSSKLFIYKKCGDGVITASATAPHDSYYSNDKGITWIKDNPKRRAMKFYILPGSPETQPAPLIGSLCSDANTVILVNGATLSETEKDFYNGLKDDGTSVNIVAYTDATFDNLKKYKTIFVLEYNERLSADVLYQLYNAGAEIKLIGTASKYINQMDITDTFTEV